MPTVKTLQKRVKNKSKIDTTKNTQQNFYNGRERLSDSFFKANNRLITKIGSGLGDLSIEQKYLDGFGE
ncbi:MAG: hypothetical protein HW421_2583 [Ignavibacteria bacterium]|nr:hypothetical protein [Ignavibacteria bacterium]